MECYLTTRRENHKKNWPDFLIEKFPRKLLENISFAVEQVLVSVGQFFWCTNNPVPDLCRLSPSVVTPIPATQPGEEDSKSKQCHWSETAATGRVALHFILLL